MVEWPGRPGRRLPPIPVEATKRTLPDLMAVLSQGDASARRIAAWTLAETGAGLDEPTREIAAQALRDVLRREEQGTSVSKTIQWALSQVTTTGRIERDSVSRDPPHMP